MRGRWGVGPRAFGVAVGARLAALAAGLATVAMAGAVAVAARATTAAAPGPGYSCTDVLTHQGPHQFTLTTALGTTRVVYAGRLGPGTGLPLAHGGTLTVTSGRSRLTLRGLGFVDGSGIVSGTGGDQLCALRFGPEAHPEILLQPYSGGAHCCYLPMLYGYSARARTYRLTARTSLTESGAVGGRMPPYNPNGGLGPRLVQGHLVLATSDGRFPYQFACFACSAAPLLLLTDRDGHFADVTRLYPSAVAADARSLWTGIQEDLRSHSEILGVVPAWAADQCRLGHAGAAFAAVDRLLRAGDLSSKLGPGFDGTGAAYVRNLRAFLGRTGYCA